MTRVFACAVGLAACGLPFSAAAATPAGETVSPLVVGGVPVDAATYPATGALVLVLDPAQEPAQDAAQASESLLVCTATLIAPRALLTAAHCIDPATPLEFTLSANIDPATPASRFAIRQAYVYPGFDLQSKGSLHDIAILELEEPLTGVTPEATLPPSEAAEYLAAGVSVELVGYGPTQAASDALGVKNAARATVASVGVDEMTVGGPGQAQDCIGDSGGPAFVVDSGGVRRLAGVTSRSANAPTPCVAGTIQTRVDAYADWIASTLSTIDADDPANGAGCAVAGAPGGDVAEGAAWLTMCAWIIFLSSERKRRTLE